MIKDVNIYNNSIKKVLDININNLKELKNKAILITGGNGLIGSALIDTLNYLNINNNYNIKIFTIVRDKNQSLERIKKYKNCKLIEQDIIDEINCDEKIDYIIHAASNANPEKYVEDPVGTMLGNFIGMNNVLKFAVNNNCKKVEYISSGEIYGQGNEKLEMFDEKYIGKVDSLNTRSCYPLSKLASETLCVSYSKQYDIETVIARPCHVYGPTQTEKDNRASAQFLRKALKKENIIMKSDGSQIRSYCYVLDCVTAILSILTKGENLKAYNIANENSIISIKEMAEIIAKQSDIKIIKEIPTEKEKSGYNSSIKTVLNNEQLKKIGWKPYYNFEEGINECLRIMQ